jgi:hypothetical protein
MITIHKTTYSNYKYVITLSPESSPTGKRIHRFAKTLEGANEHREELSSYVAVKVAMSIGMRHGEVSRIDCSRVNTAG